MGREIDDALVLGMLLGAQGREDFPTSLASMSMSTSSLKAAAFCDAVAGFYATIINREMPERFQGGGQDNIVGLAEDGPAVDAAMLAKTLDQKNAEGEPLYTSAIERVLDTANPAIVIRNTLTAYHDQNAIIVATGPLTNLAKVLTLGGTQELIAAKVKFLVVEAGTFPSGAPEHNIQADVAAARKVFAEWPTQIVIAGAELGKLAPFAGESIEQDFGWTPNHPIAEAYRAHKAMPYDTASSALAAALYALRPEGDYFGMSENGTLEVLDDGRTKFTPSADGKHSYLTLDDAKKDAVAAAYREFVSAEPPARQPPRPRRPPAAAEPPPPPLPPLPEAPPAAAAPPEAE